MSAWDQLIEAKIRDWQERQRRGEAPRTTADLAPVESLETQLFAEIIELRRRARDTPVGVQRHDLLRQCEELRTRLSVLLEKHGLPLLARSLDQRIEAALAGDD